MITNIKVYPVNGNKSVKANVTFVVGGVLSVKGAILASEKGDFVSLPGAYKYTDKETGAEKWANPVKFISREVGDAAQKLLLSEYNSQVKGGSTKTGTKTATKSDEIPF
jgi:DNA-binding cell septation regulator SpoVG